VALPGTAVPQVKTVYSHPQALAQCDRFLRSLSGVEVVATYDTAGSAKLIRERHLTTAAAIASERAAHVFELQVLQSGIQDFADNVTRFLILGRGSTAEDSRVPDADKTTIVFALPNSPGALFKALSVFALREIDLTKLESRPIPGRPWEYLFYADLAIGTHELKCGRALTHLAEFATSLRTLGSYRGVTRTRG
jgi:prephenate dehydratase